MISQTPTKTNPMSVLIFLVILNLIDVTLTRNVMHNNSVIKPKTDESVDTRNTSSLCGKWKHQTDGHLKNGTETSASETADVEALGGSGRDLFELVTAECGGLKVCKRKEANDKEITVGFLAPYKIGATLLGAMPLAVANVNRDPTLLPGHRLRYVAADIGGPIPSLPQERDSLILRVMTQMRDIGVMAFFGLDGACHSEAQLAAAWNLPLISHKCTGARNVQDGASTSLGATFARTLPPATKVSKSVVALLKNFGWDQFAIIAGDELVDALQQMEAIRELAHAHGMTITAEHIFKDYLPKKIHIMEEIVQATYTKTRIYVFLGQFLSLVDFVKVLRARGLTSGRYAVVAVDDEIYDPATGLFASSHTMQKVDKEMLPALQIVLKLTSSFPTNANYSAFSAKIRTLSAAPPFCVPNYHRLFQTASVPIEAAHLYDAVLLWARAATAILAEGRTTSDGAALIHMLRPTTYNSVQGFDVHMDEAGDAEGNYTVIALSANASAPDGWLARSVATFRHSNASHLLPTVIESAISWPGGAPPVAEPACGFDGTKCYRPHDPGLMLAAGAVAVAAVFFMALLMKHYRYEQKLASLLWKVDARELTFIHPYEGIAKASTSQDLEARRAHTTVAVYRGNIVAYKRLQKKSIDVTRAIKKELKQIRELRHENLNAFIGVCVESGTPCILTTYCSRGSLARVLADRDLHLDDMFVASLVTDLLRGLTYIHDSALVSHGNLTSSNCLVDSRWVLQIADYGLHNLKSGCLEVEDVLRLERRMLWRAPELLREPSPPPRGTQKGDVYSFGIVLYEIIGRKGPWGDTNLTNAEIIGRVGHPIGDVIFRPPTSCLAVRPSVLEVLTSCWCERPERRPDLRLVRLKLKDMHIGMKANIFDNILAIMEKYASNLEATVAERTEQLMREKRRTDDLLNRMLPRTVAEALKRGAQVKAESFECVTIYFSDIVAFTQLAATLTPMQVVDILNDLYTCLDSIISHYTVYKVETIGDGYMVVGGVPERCTRHAEEVAALALHVLAAVPRIHFSSAPHLNLQIRIGIHSGACAAGVVGVKMPRYCLFGDTVNTAARMESAGEPQRAHVSHDTYRLLRNKGYNFKPRGTINIKGKGDMKTWWLVGQENKTRVSPINTASTTPQLEELCPAPTIMLSPWEMKRTSSLCGASSSSSPAPACACFEPPTARHSAPCVTFLQR